MLVVTLPGGFEEVKPFDPWYVNQVLVHAAADRGEFDIGTAPGMPAGPGPGPP